MHGVISPTWMNDDEQVGQVPCDSGNLSWNSFDWCRDDECFAPQYEFNHNPYVACRVGEAKVPGPFRISALNVQSLHCALNENKMQWHFNQVLALSETCATQFVLDKASKAAAARARHSFSTNAVKRRTFKRGTISESRGESAGTWVASTSHCRPILTPWPDDISKLCRVCDAVIYTPDGPIYLACLYGFHQGFPEASARTDKILEAVFERSQLLKIPAVVVGDFNSTLENLPVWGCMRERGWQDAAQTHQQRTGLSPVPTFKEVSRIDYIIMNELASRAFLSYDASEMPISDHRLVSAEFNWQASMQDATIYRMPRDIAQLGIPGQFFAEARVPVAMQLAFDLADANGSVDNMWTAFTDSMEQVYKNVVSLQGNGPIPRKYLGKEKCKFVKTQTTAPILKKGRDDAFQSQVEDCGVMLRQRITQIRRFDAYLAQCAAAGPVTEPRANAMHTLWNAILKARGFPGGFPSWFLEETDALCPLQPPVANIAKWMREKLSDLVPKWRSHYCNTRVRQIRDAFDKDWARGGRLFHQALKSPQPPPVDAIDRSDQVEAQLMRARRKGLVTFRLLHDDLHIIKIGQKWTQGSAEGFVASHVSGSVSLRVTKGSFKTGLIQLSTTCQNPQQALRLATDYWETFWRRSSPVDCSHDKVRSIIQALPQLGSVSAHIELGELQNALRTLPVGKARGMDAISNWELKHLCPGLQQMLLRILNRVVSTGQWPQPLTNARMHLIRKNHEPGDITSTRPICILPNVYRLWGKIMTSKCFRHLRSRIPPSLCGSVPGRSAIDLAMQLQAEVEHHLITGAPLYGASLDLHKAFNTLDRPTLGKMCSRLGLDSIWAPYESFLGRLNRYFTLQQQWSQPIKSTTGVPEGCPLSVVMMLITTWAITNHLQSSHPTKQMSSYVDDWTVRDTSPEALVQQLDIVKEATSAIGLSLSQ